MQTQIDHLVVAARDLDQGVAWARQTLGVTPGPGGAHARFGTHNRLLKIASDAWPQAYLEIIAIDPQLPPPGRPRWFGLDERDPQAPPQLVHWVLRCEDLASRVARLQAAGWDPGQVTPASRATPQGELRWQITVRDDGRPQGGGALPTLIQWGERHPTQHMSPSGLALHSLAIGPLPESVRSCLPLPGLGCLPAPGIQAALLTPRGRVLLSTPSTPSTPDMR